MKEIENIEYMDALSEKIRHGISPEVALQTTENKTGKKISIPTLYLRIDRGLMKCTNLDLRNKVKRKQKDEESKEQKHNTGKHRANNGCEFLNYEEIEKSALGEEKRTNLYYADPYASHEKGQIENQHRLIRYFYPKGVDFGKYKDEEIIEKINRINNYPRRNLGWSTPYKEMEEIIGKELLNK